MDRQHKTLSPAPRRWYNKEVIFRFALHLQVEPTERVGVRTAEHTTVSAR